MTKMASIMMLAAVAACQSGDTASTQAPEPAPTPGAAEPLYAEPPLDLGGSVPAAALAFQSDGAAFRGGYQTHEVALVDGIVDVTPWHRDPATGQRRSGGAIGIQTTAVAIGDTDLPIGAGAARLAGGNVIEIPRGEVVERITNREDGIEQAWRFATQPRIPGDLTVEVAVAGHRFVEATASGLHFASERGLGFRYSHAIWRDAAGAAWDIAARYEDGRIVMTVPEDVLATSAYPAVLDPTVSGEQYTDVPVNGTTGANSRMADLASDGVIGYFAVWADQRDSRDDDIFATRLTATGEVADPVGIRVNGAAGVQQNPVAAYIGSGGYLVAWEHVVAAGNSDIAAAFVAADGTVTQLGTIAGTSANETLPAIAGRAGAALLVWHSGGDVRGARFGLGLFGPSFPIAAGANVEKDPAVAASSNGDYLVTFTETVGTNDNVRGQLINALGLPSGAVIDLAIGTGLEGSSTVAFDGTNFVVAWSAVHSGTSNDIAARRVGPTGALLEAAPVDVNRVTGAQLSPDIACNPGGCFIVWEDTRNLMVSLRDILGAVVSPTLAVVANDIAVSTFVRQQTAPAAASAGGGFLGAWSDTRDLDTTSVRATRVDAAGAVVDAAAAALVIVRSTSNYQAPAVGQTSGFFDVFWAESQVPDVNLVHVRFNGQSTLHDPAPLLVSGAPGAQLAPSATGLGEDSLVVWQDSRGADRDIYAARLDTFTGETFDPNGIQVTAGIGDQVVPKVASSGTSALVVWQDRRAGSFDIMGAIVTSAGTVPLTDISICAAAGDQTRPNVAYDATSNVYLVVWTDPQGGTLDIRGARVSPAGAVLDASCGTVISGAAGSQFSADIAAGAGLFLVAWEDRRNQSNSGDIYGSRVSAAGGITVVDPAGLPIAVQADSHQAEPSVAFGSGGSFVVAWTDDRNAATNANDILGAQVAPNTGIAGAPFTIAGTTEAEGSPDMSAGTTPAKPFSVAYLKRNSALGSSRVQLRRITVGSTVGTACTADSQCESGFCRDYKCCNSDCGGGGAAGNTRDCQSCSLAHYGQTDGTCTLIVNTQYICRIYASSFCDLSERCDGISTSCPPDRGQRQGQVCNATTGAVCPPNDATGAPHVCPP